MIRSLLSKYCCFSTRTVWNEPEPLNINKQLHSVVPGGIEGVQNVHQHVEQKTVNTEKRIAYLENINLSDPVPFTFPVYCGKVVKVYDGDTITIAAKLPYDSSPIYRFSVRMLGIDCAEIKGKTPNEKQIAIRARDALHAEIFGKIVYLSNIANDKYGRILADVYYNGINMSYWMLENKLAVPYDGGTKIRDETWN